MVCHVQAYLHMYDVTRGLQKGGGRETTECFVDVTTVRSCWASFFESKAN